MHTPQYNSAPWPTWEALSEAVWAAYRRTVELGEQLEASAAAPDGPAGR